MNIRGVLAATLLCGSLAFSQMGPGGPVHGGRGPGGAGRLGFHGGKVIAGAPYSATVTDTSVKTLADGNTIQRTMSGTVARDSQGRTYSTETVTGMFGPSGTKTMTFIYDPVAGYEYTLNAEAKTATRRQIHVRTPGSEQTTHERPADPNVVSQDQGTQTVNGLSAQGKLITHTIPAGAMGNEKPIVSTTESWYSPDLQVVISSRRTDPQQGTNTYALTNIQRAEPAATLFQVPSEYAVKDAPAFGGRH